MPDQGMTVAAPGQDVLIPWYTQVTADVLQVRDCFKRLGGFTFSEAAKRHAGAPIATPSG